MSDKQKSGVEQAFEDHRKAQAIKEAADVWETFISAFKLDAEHRWAEETVLEAAREYASLLEWNAYRNPDVRRSLIRAEVESLATEEGSRM
jgi:hypothetical protein